MTEDCAFGADDVAGTVYAGQRLGKLRFLMTDNNNAVLEEILDEVAVSSRNRHNPRGVKRKMSNFPLRRGYKRLPLLEICAAIRIVK